MVSRGPGFHKNLLVGKKNTGRTRAAGFPGLVILIMRFGWPKQDTQAFTVQKTAIGVAWVPFFLVFARWSAHNTDSSAVAGRAF